MNTSCEFWYNSGAYSFEVFRRPPASKIEYAYGSPSQLFDALREGQAALNGVSPTFDAYLAAL
jgi:hypothetical protein